MHPEVRDNHVRNSDAKSVHSVSQQAASQRAGFSLNSLMFIFWVGASRFTINAHAGGARGTR